MSEDVRRACVIGWPVAQSRSPLIHRHWLELHGIKGDYIKQPVAPDDLPSFLSDLAGHGFVGCNVTVPHKEAALAAADHALPEALAIGAANTLWLEDGTLFATNTDAYGFMTHLGCSVQDWRATASHVVVLGAGGAARAIIYGLLDAGVPRVHVANRTLARAEALATHFGDRVRACAMEEVAGVMKGASLLINTTSLGMEGKGALGIDLGPLPDNAVVSDIVYVPLQTELLKQAQSRGLRTVDGLGMLLHQAVPGFERWFGVKPEVTQTLRNIILNDLGVAVNKLRSG